MSTVQRKRNFEAANNDVWRYRTVNNFKILTNFNDVPRFIMSICRLWSIEKYQGGNEFIKNFCNSIEDWRETPLDGFEYINDNGDACYFLLLIRPYHDKRSTEVVYTHHTLSKSLVISSNTSEVMIEPHNAWIWLKQRAFNELHLSDQNMAKLMSKAADSSTIGGSEPPVHSSSNKKMLTKQIQSNSTGTFSGQSIDFMNKKQTHVPLESTDEKLQYNQHCHQAD